MKHTNNFLGTSILVNISKCVNIIIFKQKLLNKAKMYGHTTTKMSY